MGLVKFTGSRADTRNWYQRASAWIFVLLIAIGLGGCNRPEIQTTLLLDAADGPHQAISLQGKLSEVSPPDSLQALKPFLDLYEPQLQILSPREGATLTDTTVTVQVQVRDLPIYKDADLGLGPHFHLALDDQPGQDVYEPDATIAFEDIAPGTHTLRAFAARPWHESFKNAGAFDQVTFNIFTPSSKNDAGQGSPLLTYSQPQGVYGAEPILLDFYLTNVPLHLIAAKDDSLSDWRIRCTVNGEAFVFDRWQPLYLKGFNPGQNWVKVELVDEAGKLFPGPFNSAIGVVEYRPGETDPLSQLIRGNIPVETARVLVDPNYEPPAPESVLEDPLEPSSEVTELDAETQNDQIEENSTQIEPNAQTEPLASDAIEDDSDALVLPDMGSLPREEPAPNPILEQGSAETTLPSDNADGEKTDAANLPEMDKPNADTVTEPTPGEPDRGPRGAVDEGDDVPASDLPVVDTPIDDALETPQITSPIESISDAVPPAQVPSESGSEQREEMSQPTIPEGDALSNAKGSTLE